MQDNFVKQQNIPVEGNIQIHRKWRKSEKLNNKAV